jgi:hypothetical protein
MQKVIAILEHVRSQSKLGLVIQATIQWMQHSLRVGFDILWHLMRRIPPSTDDTCVRGVCEFLARSKCQLERPDRFQPAP